MKKYWTCLGMIAALTISSAAVCHAIEFEEETDIDYEIVTEVVTDEMGEEHLAALDGSYVPMYDIILKEEYDALWMDNLMLIYEDEDEAKADLDAILSANTGKLVGEEAIEAYDDGENYEEMAFCSDFLNGLAHLSIDHGTISGEDADGNELFSYSYTFDSYDDFSGLYLYKADADDAGMFSWFCFTYDEPGLSNHVEFRYGDSPADLINWVDGQYAYWMACGITDGEDQAEQAEAIITTTIEDYLLF